jgi:microcompartment protein CcmK/EutM
VKLTRVVGHVVLSRSIEPYGDKTLHVIQDVDRQLQGTGDPEIALTWQAMEEGDLVVVEISREACNAFDTTIPADAVIIGRADRVHIDTAS